MIDSKLKTMYDNIATGNQSPGKEHVFHDMLLNEPGFGIRRGWEGASIEYACYRKCSAHRKDLLGIMAACVPGERVVFGKRATSIKHVKNGNGHGNRRGKNVRITFADGDVVEADAVIGCDGGKGVSRQAVLRERYPDQVNATYSGRYVYRTIVPMEKARSILGSYAGDGKMFLGEEKYFAMYQMTGGMQLNVLAGRQSGEPWTSEQWTEEVAMEDMMADFEGCDERLVRLLDVSVPFLRITQGIISSNIKLIRYFNYPMHN